MPDISEIDSDKWREAQRRADVIRPLIADGQLSRAAAKQAAQTLGLSERYVYALARRYLEGNGVLTEFTRNAPSGGRGKSRLNSQQETIILEVIESKLPDKRRFSVAAMTREILLRCKRSGVKVPSSATIRRRIQHAPSILYQQRDGTKDTAIPLTGETPSASFPLAVIQMDHTPVDLILVDPVERLPIGRPYLTLAIDVFSRCIAGMHIDLEPPSATSVGLCLTHIASDKSAWLSQRKIEGEWSIQGKPLEIGVDNAREFKSQAFLRGCAQHGITVNYRPPGQPHFGGVIERVIGTLMKITHEVPGTTKSNPADRGKYDSEDKACLTFEEFERYLTIAITQYYHHAFHHGLGDIPLRRLQQAPASHKTTSVANPQSYLMDFLPASRRALRREGFVLDHITYYSSAFQNWLREGKLGETFVIRRDPRDLSRIYVSVPEGSGYIEAAYRKLSHPVITLFEHRAAVRRLSSHAKSSIDEEKLFRAIEEMRRIEAESTQATLKTRREKERRRRANAFHSHRQLPVKQESDSSTLVVEEEIAPFQEIELW